MEAFLSKKRSGFDRLRLSDRHMTFDLGGRPFPAGPSAKSHQHAKRAIEAAATAGYFCYDEMFVWADALLEDYPAVPGWFAHRFPLIILDEMQDTYERQASFLSAVFPRTSDKIVVQRVGDPNQQIFDLPDSGSDVRRNPFPTPIRPVVSGYRTATGSDRRSRRSHRRSPCSRSVHPDSAGSGRDRRADPRCRAGMQFSCFPMTARTASSKPTARMRSTF